MTNRNSRLCRFCRRWCGRRHGTVIPQILLFTPEGRAITMNIKLPNDVVRRIPITVLDAGGDVVAAGAGDKFSVVVSDTVSLAGSIGTMSDDSSAALILNALVPLATGISITVSDAQGLATFEGTVDIVADLRPTTISLDLADAVDTTQPVPAAAAASPAGGASVPGGASTVGGGANTVAGGANSVAGGASTISGGANTVAGGASTVPGGASTVPGGADTTASAAGSLTGLTPPAAVVGTPGAAPVGPATDPAGPAAAAPPASSV